MRGGALEALCVLSWVLRRSHLALPQVDDEVKSEPGNAEVCEGTLTLH